MAFTVVQISDLHHDPAIELKQQATQAVIEQVNAMKPDLVVASGDLSDDGYCKPGLFEKIAEQLKQLNAPIVAVPGNHDTGHKTGEPPIKKEYQDEFAAAFGDWKFVVEKENWRLIGLNSQIFGSGLAYDDEQWQWFEQQLDQADAAGQQVAVFTHEVPYIVEPNELFNDHSDYWSYVPAARQRFLKLMDRPSIKLFATGHLHWRDERELLHAKWIWCPSASIIVDDARFPSGGEALGCYKYTFTDDGVSYEFVPYPFERPKIYYYRPKVELPEGPTIEIGQVALDFTGTLSKDGVLLDGVAERIRALSQMTRMTVMSADTFGKAQQALEGLPLTFKRIANGRDKHSLVTQMGAESVVAIGNGRNDVEMVKVAAIGIAVVGPEGGNGELIRSADIMVRDIRDALDLIANPLRLKATLRQ